MSSEISPIETGQTDLTDRVCDRVLEILEYKNENPEKEWSKNPELVYMDVESADGKQDTISIKKFNISNYPGIKEETRPGLFITLFYIPYQISLKQLSRTKLKDCEPYNVTISEGEETKIIRGLYGRITSTESETKKASPDEVQESLDRLSIILTPTEKRVVLGK